MVFVFHFSLIYFFFTFFLLPFHYMVHHLFSYSLFISSFIQDLSSREVSILWSYLDITLLFSSYVYLNFFIIHFFSLGFTFISKLIRGLSYNNFSFFINFYLYFLFSTNHWFVIFFLSIFFISHRFISNLQFSFYNFFSFSKITFYFLEERNFY